MKVERMKKLSDWVQRFEATIARAKEKPFDWADHNCCTFAGECFEAITGENGMNTLAHTAGDKRAALRAIRKFADGGLEECAVKMAGELGLEEVPPLMAQRGDPVVAVCEGEVLVATMDLSGREILAISPKDGLIRLPMDSAIRAWRIG